ncbi:MAG: hypothetical protein AAF525_05615 [Pseudomonadota bacterium]
MRGAVLILGWFMIGTSVAEGGESFGLNAMVRVGESPIETVELSVSAGSVASVDLDNDLRIEFAAPLTGSVDPTETRLFRRTAAGLELLHSARQGGSVSNPRRNGYVLCGEQVRFVAPVSDDLPGCQKQGQESGT